MCIVAGRASPVSASSGVDGLDMEVSRAFLAAPRVGVGALAASPGFGGHALLGGLLVGLGGGHHCWFLKLVREILRNVLNFKSLDLCKEASDGRKGKPRSKYKTVVYM